MLCELGDGDCSRCGYKIYAETSLTVKERIVNEEGRDESLGLYVLISDKSVQTEHVLLFFFCLRNSLQYQQVLHYIDIFAFPWV